MSQVYSLNEFILNWPLEGKWQLSYYDRTHLEEGKVVQLGEVSIQGDETATPSSLYFPFIFRPASEAAISTSLKDAGVYATDPVKCLQTAGMIRKLLAESVARCGMARYELELLGRKTPSDALPYLSELPYIILVTDTGAVRRGISTFLTISLPHKTIWTIIPVFVMIEIQERADNIKENIRREASEKAPDIGKYVRVLNQRPQVSCASREIQNIKLNRPIEFIQAAPELISRVKGFTKQQLVEGKDRLRDSLNDRLIIEATKQLRQERSLGKELFLATSDKHMASLAQMENVDAIYIKETQLPKRVVSIRYNSFTKRFIVCPLHSFLWDLTHIFSSIILSNGAGKQLRLNYYTEDDLTKDVLEITES